MQLCDLDMGYCFITISFWVAVAVVFGSDVACDDAFCY
ncbi:Protein of unknown function [Pyronema omphalodes CBS 100304]|uniref:Uncharacterized protein n=1 Tax=Pyronema omphalodes (strain CBS 100304) TaxID=1076935 RepID=U4L454_PYROM|nr:Protein of unknown function [Pyronema omphalodes CBS 100304]